MLPFRGGINTKDLYGSVPSVLTPENTYLKNVQSIRPGCRIAYFPLTQESGIPVVDEFGIVPNGTANGVTWADTPGPGVTMGSAPLFDGINDYIDVFSAALAALVDLDGTLTMTAWVKIPAGVWTDNVAHTVLSLYQAFAVRMEMWKLALAGGNDLAGLYGANQSKYDTTSTDWIHLCTTFSGNSVVLYVNGVAQTPAVYAPLNVTITSALIGESIVAGGGFYFKGHIGHVTLWSCVLSQPEITLLATAV